MVDSRNFTLAEIIGVGGRGKGYGKNSRLGMKGNQCTIQSHMIEHSILITAVKH